MNNDRFTDIIRRKLESIRPDFTEKDWVRMQATLRQATPPPPDSLVPPSVVRPGWISQPWLMAAAAVSTVVLITVGVWQRQQINDLRQTVRQLAQQRVATAPPTAKTTKPDPANPAAPTTPLTGRTTGDQPTAARPEATSATGIRPGADQPGIARVPPANYRPDTVYVTRYLPAPVPPRPSGTKRQAQRGTAPANQSDPTDQPTSAATRRQEPTQPANAPYERVADAPTKSQKPTDRVLNPSGGQDPVTAVDKLTERANADRIAGKTTRRPGSGRYETGGQSGSNLKVVPTNQPTQPGSSPAQTGQPDAVNQPVLAYELMTSRPTQFGTTDWNAALLRRVNRTKPVRTTTVGGQAPESQPVKHLAVRFRLGAGADVSKNVWSLGAFTEVAVGRHWTLNLGLSQASHTGETFFNEIDYKRQTKKEFWKDFGQGNRPGRDFLAIELRMTRVQLPVNLGYRMPLNQTLALLPSVGTNLNLRSSEHVIFYQRLPYPGSEYERGDRRFDRRVATFDNLSFGTALEWQQKHWVAQAGPLLTAPLQTDPKWQTSLTAGLRARVLYQF